MAEIGSCMYSLAQFSAHPARKHSQNMPSAWERWPETSNSTVVKCIILKKDHVPQAVFSSFLSWGEGGNPRNCSNGVTDILPFRSYLLPKKGAEPVTLKMMDCDLSVWVASKNKKNTNNVQKPNTVLVAVCHSPPSPYRLPVGSSANNYGSLPSQ